MTPSQLIDFTSMKLKPQKWAEKGNAWEMGSPKPIRASNGGELNPMLTFEGNLSLVYRPIESLKDIEDRFKIKFIDMSPVNYNSTVIRYKDPQLDDTNKFEIGRSQFLTYDTYFNTPTPPEGHLYTIYVYRRGSTERHRTKKGLIMAIEIDLGNSAANIQRGFVPTKYWKTICCPKDFSLVLVGQKLGSVLPNNAFLPTFKHF